MKQLALSLALIFALHLSACGQAVDPGSRLRQLRDVTITSPTTGQVLRYNSTSSKWENATSTVPISTGVTGLGAGVATFLGVPTSANLFAALTDKTGTGTVVFSNSPTITGNIVLENVEMTSLVLTQNITAVGVISTGAIEAKSGGDDPGRLILYSVGNTAVGTLQAEPTTTRNWTLPDADTAIPPITRGAGSPEGVVTGGIGDIYLRTDGGAGTTFYVKEIDGGNTGWAAK